MRYEIWGRAGDVECNIYKNNRSYANQKSAKAALAKKREYFSNEVWVKAVPDDTDRLEWLLKNSDKLDQKMSGWRIEGIKGFFKTAREAIDMALEQEKSV